MTSTATTDRTDVLAAKLADLGQEIRTTIGLVDDLQARAMLETSAEVLGGLRHAFCDFKDGIEAAWKR